MTCVAIAVLRLNDICQIGEFRMYVLFILVKSAFHNCLQIYYKISCLIACTVWNYSFNYAVRYVCKVSFIISKVVFAVSRISLDKLQTALARECKNVGKMKKIHEYFNGSNTKIVSSFYEF